MVESAPASSGDTDLTPGLGTKIPHAAGQLSLRATTPGACVSCNRRTHHSEKPEHREEGWPPLAATGERLCSAKDRAQPKKQKNLEGSRNGKEAKEREIKLPHCLYQPYQPPFLCLAPSPPTPPMGSFSPTPSLRELVLPQSPTLHSNWDCLLYSPPVNCLVPQIILCQPFLFSRLPLWLSW